jgi:hypothetical protein
MSVHLIMTKFSKYAHSAVSDLARMGDFACRAVSPHRSHHSMGPKSSARKDFPLAGVDAGNLYSQNERIPLMIAAII